jgi:hypothetical protein
MVADAMCNENWIHDVMHEITITLLVEYIMIWILIGVATFDPGDGNGDEIIWTRTQRVNTLPGQLMKYNSMEAWSLPFR